MLPFIIKNILKYIDFFALCMKEWQALDRKSYSQPKPCNILWMTSLKNNQKLQITVWSK
jgi:hypothetical protein